MAGFGTLRSIILEHLGFDNNREPIAAFDEVGNVTAPNVAGRRLALLVSATLRDRTGIGIVNQAPNADGIPAAGAALPVIAYLYRFNPQTGLWDRVAGLNYFRAVSAANTSQQIVIDMDGLSQLLEMDSQTSAGTATLTIEVSTDNTNWLQVDSIAAAADISKHYGNATTGATRAMCPMGFRYVRVTAGAAGVGNTTTLTISGK
jgi:hypothetical protein